ncbi:MAG: twin-arginine translocase subunit TatC [Alistipes sp.]|nr:twin-arginine translocase subunit TatC [Alistipes sp.]
MAAPAETDRMSFFEHIEALRPHLVRSVVVVCLLTIAAFLCKRWLIDGVLFGPLSASFPTNRLIDLLASRAGIDYRVSTLDTVQLINNTVAGQFNLHLRLSFITALIVAIPYLLGEVWSFVRPALTESEVAHCRRLAGRATAGFLLGLLFGYFIIAPLSISFLTQYSLSESVQNLIDVRSYLSTVVQSSVACALLFLLPLLVQLLCRVGLLSSDFLARYRRHAIVVLALLAAVITPPDAFSMVLVLGPLMLLYEYSIRVARRTEMRK